MFSTISLLIATFLILTVRSQMWTGTYTADSICNQTVCCCFSGQIVVTSPSATMLSIGSGLSGQCSGLTMLATNVSYPSGYTGYLPMNTINITLTLSNDSQTIHAIYPSIYSACNGNAYKNSAVKQFGNNILMIALICIGLTKTVFYP